MWTAPRRAVGAAQRLLDIGQRDTLLDVLAHQVELVHVDLRTLLEFLVGEEAVDALGRNRAVADGGGQQMWPQHVAAGENARLAADLVVAVRPDCALAVVELFESGEVDGLPDRRDDQVGRDVAFGAFLDLDLEPRADHLGLALCQSQRGRATIGSAHDAHRRQAALDVDAFGLRLLDLVLVGLHAVDGEHRRQRDLGALLDRDLRDIVRHVAGDRAFEVGRLGVLDVAEAPRHGRDVDRRVAAADDHDALADMAQPPVVERPQERGGGDDVRRLGIGDRQRAAGLRPHAEEDRVEILAQLLERHVGTDAALQSRLDAEIENALDLGVEHFARRAEAGDAVAHHAAEVLALVEDRDLMALECELIGARQPGRPAADHRDLLARALLGRRKTSACSGSPTRRDSARPS